MLRSNAPNAAIPFHHAIERKFSGAVLPPLLILLHGSGDNEHGLLDVGHYLAPACGNAVILSLRGPRSRGPGFCWFEGSSASPAADAEESIGWAADQVLHLLENAPSELGTDPSRTYLFGHSQGASISWAVGLSKWSRPDLVRGIACNSGRLFPALAQPTSALGQRVASAAELAQRHVLSAHGQDDMITPVVHGQQNGQICEALGLRNSYHEHDEGHNDLQKPLVHVLRHFAAVAAA